MTMGEWTTYNNELPREQRAMVQWQLTVLSFLLLTSTGTTYTASVYSSILIYKATLIRPEVLR
jgi:hypothetical protein